jgi:hypothetical protein
MQFNRYIFDLYLLSPEGKESLKIWTEFLDWEKWEDLDFESLSKQINSSLIVKKNFEELKELFIEIKKEIKITQKEFKKALKNRTKEEVLSDAKQYWSDVFLNFDEKNKINRENLAVILKKSIYQTVLNFSKNLKKCVILGESIYQTVLNPHFFFPYFFVSQFNLIENLFKEFDLILPPLPKVRDYKARLNYYFELCEVLYYFRLEHQMKPAEFLAFLYGFVGNFIQPKLEENENPLRVWITGGGKEDYDSIIRSRNTDLHHWTGSLESAKSDLQLIYFRAPFSGIGAVSICLSGGYYDPFDYYESRVIISKIKTFEFITLTELRENSVWKNKSLVKRNMQGVKRQNVTFEEYQELKNILKAKNQNPDILPELESVVIDTNLDLQNERDVEIQLLEPLLKKLGFSEKNWIRQLPLRMGRGERNYPDYALFVDNKKKHEETAKFLWEAKFRIRNQKELRDAFLQAKSYARRLNSSAFGLCAVEGIWISNSKDGFDFEKLEFLKWGDLKENTNWVKLKNFFL